MCVVGESHYQAAIRGCRIGEPARIVYERGNPSDPQALAVESCRGEKVGYVARSSWLRDAIHEEGQGCSATIEQIAPGGGGALGVVLRVTLDDTVLVGRAFGRESSLQRGLGGLLARLFGR